MSDMCTVERFLLCIMIPLLLIDYKFVLVLARLSFLSVIIVLHCIQYFAPYIKGIVHPKKMNISSLVTLTLMLF